MVHGASLHRELQHLVGAGLTPSDRGVIEAGARADLVLVAGDPTTDIRDTTEIQRVWISGRELDDSYIGGNLESEGIAWLHACTAKILQGIRDTWPSILGS